MFCGHDVHGMVVLKAAGAFQFRTPATAACVLVVAYLVIEDVRPFLLELTKASPFLRSELQ